MIHKSSYWFLADQQSFSFLSGRFSLTNHCSSFLSSVVPPKCFMQSGHFHLFLWSPYQPIRNRPLLIEPHVPDTNTHVKHANRKLYAAMHQSATMQPANQHPAWDPTCRGVVSLVPVMSLVNHMIRRDLGFFMDNNPCDRQLRMLPPCLAERRRQRLKEGHKGQSGSWSASD